MSSQDETWFQVFAGEPQLRRRARALCAILAMAGGMSIAPLRVSVVVPVFNPGPSFDELVQSFDAQTLEARSFEVILCDDGSDEATRDRLDQIARARPNVRVLTLAHSGWPGTPRNHGIEAARGEYVFFADQDDRLFDAALQQLCDYGDRHSSDVVVGRVVGIGRKIPRQIFRRDIPQAVLGRDPLLELLTPHKLFRRSFLQDNGIRFPDGRVRLEDHLFVMRAYFSAKTISVLASRPCYAWVKNQGSASSSRIDPITYFPHLETVLDLVEANTVPGELRDTLLRHWYRSKILRRLGGRRLVRYPDDYRERFLDVVTPIAQQRFGAGVEDGLPLPLRIRSALLRSGRRDDLVRFAEFEAELEGRAEVVSAAWSRRGKLTLSIRARVVRNGEDIDILELEQDAAPHRRLDVNDLCLDRIDLLLSDEGGQAERRIRGRAPQDVTARVTIDPLHVFSRRDRSTGGQLEVELRHAGWTLQTTLRADQATLQDIGRSPVLAGRRYDLVLNRDGTLALRRDWPAGQFRDLAARAVRRAGFLARRTAPRRREVKATAADGPQRQSARAQ
jgi:glycosyltransferase involved in cell wall biosynthesis